MGLTGGGRPLSQCLDLQGLDMKTDLNLGFQDNSDHLQFSQESQRDQRDLCFKHILAILLPVICLSPWDPESPGARQIQSRCILLARASSANFVSSFSFCFTGRRGREPKAISCLSLLSGTVFTGLKCHQGLIVTAEMGVGGVGRLEAGLGKYFVFVFVFIFDFKEKE